jgi:dolichol-phosphate mannosyltransferase
MVYSENSTPVLSLIAINHNGGENLSTLVTRVHKVLGSFKYELIIVDGNSSDGIEEVAKELSNQYPTKFINNKDGENSSSAVIAGLNQARGEILGVMDASMQHPPEKLPELLQALEKGADIAVASRYIPGGGIDTDRTKGKAISKGSAILTRLVLPSVRKVSDPMSGFFLLKRKVLDGIELKPGPKILLQALSRGGGEVREVPYIEEGVGQNGAFSFGKQLNNLENIFLLATKERELRRFIQFCLVGLSGVAINMGTFWLLTRFVGLYDLIALILGLVASIVSNFILNDIWTFRDRRIGSIKATLVRVLKFDLISIGAIAIYYGIYTPLTRFWLGEDSLLALAIAVGVGLIWNFSINTLWTWRNSEEISFTDP